MEILRTKFRSVTKIRKSNSFKNWTMRDPKVLSGSLMSNIFLINEYHFSFIKYHYHLYRIKEVLSYSLHCYCILRLLCLIIFACLPAIFVDYRIFTAIINITNIKIFGKSMFKAEWRNWFLTTLSKYIKYSVVQNSLVLKLLLLLIYLLSLYHYHFPFTF